MTFKNNKAKQNSGTNMSINLYSEVFISEKCFGFCVILIMFLHFQISPQNGKSGFNPPPAFVSLAAYPTSLGAGYTSF